MRKPKQRTAVDASNERVIAIRHRNDRDDDDNDVGNDFDVEQNFAESADLDEDELESMFDGEEQEEVDNSDDADENDHEDMEESKPPKTRKMKGVPVHMREGLALYQIKNTDDDENETAVELQTLLASQKPLTRADHINEVGLLQKLDTIKLGLCFLCRFYRSL